MYVYLDALVSLTRLPCLAALGATIVLIHLVYGRRRPRGPKWGAWPAICALLALYIFAAALAPGGWDQPLVLLGVMFACLVGWTWLDPARKTLSVGAPETTEGRGWFG